MSIPVTAGEMNVIAPLVKELTGMILDDTKRYLVEARLGPLVEKAGCTSYAQLYRKVKDGDAQLREAFIDAVSINETSFFRDGKPFDLLRHKLVPDLLENDVKRQVAIWSVACATGQECYSIAMALKDILFDFSRYNVKIFGTDISEDAIRTASRGEYTPFEVKRGLVSAQLDKYFSRSVSGNYRINDDLRSVIQFRKANIFEPFTVAGMFDIIFCRNVAIYFSREDRVRLFRMLAGKMKPEAVLIIGSTETLSGITDQFERRVFHGAVYFGKGASK